MVLNGKRAVPARSDEAGRLVYYSATAAFRGFAGASPFNRPTSGAMVATPLFRQQAKAHTATQAPTVRKTTVSIRKTGVARVSVRG